jgi:hypothetical protein
VGWYSSLSRDTVAHVRHEHEHDDIQSHLRAFLKSPEQFAQMGQRGFRLLHEQHDPERYVQTILELATHAPQFRARKSAYDLARGAGKLMGSWTSSTGPEPIRIAAKIYEIYSLNKMSRG